MRPRDGGVGDSLEPAPVASVSNVSAQRRLVSNLAAIRNHRFMPGAWFDPCSPPLAMELTSHAKIAVSVWQGRIAPVFDVSRGILVVEFSQGHVASSVTHALTDGEPDVREHLAARFGIETLICGAISDDLSRAIEASGVRVIPFVAGEVEEVLLAFAAGSLPCANLSMPGCRRRWRRRDRATPCVRRK